MGLRNPIHWSSPMHLQPGSNLVSVARIPTPVILWITLPLQYS